MRMMIRRLENPQDSRVAVLVDVLGLVAIVALFYAALHLPLLA